MTRTKKLALLALSGLTLVALIAPAHSSAAKFVSETKVTEFSPSSAVSFDIAFGVGKNTYECAGLSFSGEENGSETTEGFASSAVDASSASDPSCTGLIFKMNGCKPTFNSPPGGTSNQGTIDIGPAGCAPITAKNALNCEWTIPAQSGLSATYENQGSGTGRTISVDLSTSKLKFNIVKNAGCGAVGSYSDGVLQTEFTLQGTAAGGSPVGIRVAELPVGFYLTGEKSEDPAKQPRFEAEEYPTDLVGQISKTHSFLLKEGGASVNCETGSLSAFISGPTPALDMDADYTGCAKFLGQQVSIDMHSCEHDFVIYNTNPPYSGAIVMYCTIPGDAIEIVVGNPASPICTYEMPPQYLTGVTYSVTGSLNERKVVAEVEDKSVTYTRTYNGLFCPPASSTGAFSGGFTLEGVE